MNLNFLFFFILQYKDDIIFNQSTNQHKNVLDIKIIAVKIVLKKSLIYFSVEMLSCVSTSFGLNYLFMPFARNIATKSAKFL